MKLFQQLGLPLLLCALLPATALAGEALHQDIPTHAFAANRSSNFGYKISPDGTRLAWLAVTGTTLELFIKDLATQKTSHRPAYGIKYFDWMRDGQALISDSLTETGTENNVITLFNLAPDNKDNAPHILSAVGGVKSLLLAELKDEPGVLLFQSHPRDNALFDLYQRNVAGKENILLEKNPGNVQQWLSRADGHVAGRITLEGMQYALQIRQADEHSYTTVYRWSSDDQVRVVSISNDLSSSYLLSNKGSDLSRLLQLDHQTAGETVLAQAATVDLSEVYVAPDSGLPWLVSSEPDYPHNNLLEPRLQALLGARLARSPARLHIENSDRDGRQLVYSLQTDVAKEFYLSDLEQQSTVLIGPAATAAFVSALVPSQPLVLQAGDGTLLHAYLSLPAGSRAQKWPVLIKVHGGPWERDLWTYDAQTQFLANRGYAVLQVNFRGSSGYGRHFQELAHAQWGGTMQQDLLDAANWASAQSWAQADHIGLIGGSYGGYATLMGLLTAPERFACGVAVNAPTDLFKLSTEVPPAYRFDTSLLQRYIGDPEQAVPRATMQARSPISLAAQLQRPVLLAQGEYDVRVPQQQTQAFVDASKSPSKQLEYWLMPHTGHAISDWKTSLLFFRKTERFLSHCLGGVDKGFDYYELGTVLF